MKKKILIVEENQQFIEELKEVSDILGYPLQVETSFENALLYLKENNCAAVIQEIVIANKINMDLIKLIKMGQSEQNLDIPIAIMNESMSKDYAQNMKKKLSGVIHKPFKVSTFVQIVKLLVTINFLKKLTARLYSLEKHDEVIKILGVSGAIKESSQMIKGFLEEDMEFETLACSESIEEVLTLLIGKTLSPEASSVAKSLELESNETFQALGEENLKPISQLTYPGILDLDESVVKVKGGLTEEENLPFKGENLQKAEKIMREEQDVRGDEKWVYILRTDLEKLKADILDRQNKEGQTYCMLAAGEGDFEEVKRIVKEGADITLRSKDGLNMLHWSAKGGNIEIVKFFLEKGVDLKFKDNEGNLPVALAIRYNQTEIATLMLEKMKNYQWTNKNGKSLIMEAAAIGNDEILKILLDKGAPISLKDNKHRSAFWYAKKNKHKSTMVLLKKKRP